MKKFGLIGRKLDHSFSKNHFEKKFKDLGLDYSYSNFELTDIRELKKLLGSKNLSGLNVTIPYKESCIAYLDSLSKAASQIGAVNTIHFDGEQIIGHNTDYIGFTNSIKPYFTNQMSRALILGTGGASKAVLFALKKLGVDCLKVSRTPNNNQIGYHDLTELVLKHHLLVVNTTPIGTKPNINECIQFPFEYCSENHLFVDLIYNPEETLFLKRAKKQGSKILNGYSMLCHQADASWKVWNS